jgi:hypothetical protein
MGGGGGGGGGVPLIPLLLLHVRTLAEESAGGRRARAQA